VPQHVGLRELSRATRGQDAFDSPRSALTRAGGPRCRSEREDDARFGAGYGLTTANIMYRRPDHQWLLQTLRLAGFRSFSEFSRVEWPFALSHRSARTLDQACRA